MEDTNSLLKEIVRMRQRIEEMEAYFAENAKLKMDLWNSQEMLQMAVSAANLGLWEWNIQTGELSFNSTCTELLGYSANELDTSIASWKKLLSAPDQKRFKDIISGYSSERSPVVDFECRMRTKRGTWKWVLNSGKLIEYKEDGSPVRAAGILKEYSYRKEAEDSEIESVYYDRLTGLPSYRLFVDHFLLERAYASRNKHKMAILMVNINDFDTVHKFYGQDAGENLLIQFGNRISGLLRKSDTIARRKSDEFVLLLPGLRQPQSKQIVAEKILKTCSKPYQFNGFKCLITMKIGLTIYPDDGDSIDHLLRNASIALSTNNTKNASICTDYSVLS
jgi:diguanylate cyclase (GGDEF)-like protein/PAS domain S-box-containing protein